MKNYLFCHVPNCGFYVGAELDASYDEWGEVIEEFKAHLQSHSKEELVNQFFSLMMLVRDLIGEKE